MTKPHPRDSDGVLRYKCLTMTYFHRRTSTIIGAKAFHFPVRDGKEWGHLAMVVKRNVCVVRVCVGGLLSRALHVPYKPIWEEARCVATLASR